MALTPRHSLPKSPSRTAAPDVSTTVRPAAETSASVGKSASETNDAIRALVDATAGQDWSSDAYEILLVEWAAAIRTGGPGDIVEAA
ncbi:hypothetical protein [uncultured Streptomyces sp.]|uniref:hypothetical protein n=1 Tax=uncultured Streptomyces sp. TaxID=174707 RepID=UPI0026302F7D|nr:hypothetical protein [uncultured Streptomyces sp.]